MAHRILRPATGSRPQVHNHRAGTQDTVFLLDFLQFVDRARAITITLRALDEFIIKMCFQPLVAAFTFTHGALSTGDWLTV